MEKHPARITTGEVTYHLPSSSGLFSTLTWLTMPRFFSFLASVMVFVPERKHREMYSPFRNRLTFTIQWHKSSCALFGNMPSVRSQVGPLGTNAILTHLSRDGITTKRNNVPRKVSKESNKKLPSRPVTRTRKFEPNEMVVHYWRC